MASTVSSTTKKNQGSILRIYGNGEVLVEDIYQYLNALEKAYNSAYVFNQIVEEAQEISRFYEGQRPPIPLKNLLWMNWWPPNAEKVKSFVPKSERLKLVGVELHSPGFWDFLGKLNPLEVIREYLQDHHEREKDRKYRNREEEEKLRLENEKRRIENGKARLEVFKDMGATNEQLLVVAEQLLIEPQKQLNQYQDQKIITGADIVDFDDRNIDT
jgi:hypothetical protein